MSATLILSSISALGVVATLVGGLWAWSANWRRQGARDYRIDETCKAVLGDENTGRVGLVERVHDIRMEMKPNSGGSMRDAINRIEHRLDQMEQAR